ncbi:hypothetical protein K439DRAFT_1337257, partial [Ramaria rubella]
SSSTLNTHIERLWVEVGTQFAQRWCAFFTCLEFRHHLDPSDPHHLWLIHYLFLGHLNDDCEDFCKEWSLHPMCGPETKGRSPSELRLIGETTKGKVEDDFTRIHTETLNRYLGVYGNPKHRTQKQTGAGHPPDESDEDSNSDSLCTSDSDDVTSEEDDVLDIYQDLEARVSADLKGNIKHKAVKTPRHKDPFEDLGINAQLLFEQALEPANTNNIIPSDYGLLADEWEENEYPTYEPLKCGHKHKELIFELPTEVWYPHAVTWVWGLHALNQVIFKDAEN